MPSYNIGLDFGTTNSIISYLENGKLEAFQYGGAGGEKYIPSFIAYEDDFIEIGNAARNTAAHCPDIESYGNFKMRLPIRESEFAHFFNNGRTPISVTQDYLYELLLSKESESNSFSNQQGEIAQLVVSVPEIWQRDIYNLGRERLQNLIRKLNLPLIQLVSEPVAAAAYYAWEAQRQSQQEHSESFTGNLLVCDIGGGTFDVSLCHICSNNKVEVLYFDGQGDKGLESAGVAFDRRCVQAAYKKKHGHIIDENDPEFTRLLKEFETTKISCHSKTTKKLIDYLEKPEIWFDKDIYVFSGGYTVSFGEVHAAFAPIAQGIQRVMQKMRNWLQYNNQQFDVLFLVGGFSNFYLVQKAIANALGMNDNDSKFERGFNTVTSTYAISYGACLIANGLVDPVEKYIHTLGIVVHNEVKIPTIRGMETGFEEEEITLIKGGFTLNELNTPQFYHKTLQADRKNFSVPIWVDPQSKGKRCKQRLSEVIQLPNFFSSARYRVGMRVNRSQVSYLVIEEVSSKERVEYELGNLLAKIFPSFVLSED
ncbi:Hsp70 family protein [Aetokthonos hydrillicola Thurmond2011]|jgi:molecular chaperone DnaK|uniref:Hsp70 family protein n=1 Tax=Aetokthonos hydrillicola Thurmond2011 TaxID=2712845 RepID=A0AAP5I0M9_9CYAN|nr:Hsp70 family protein [Aetokthonos hydrillicola]MBO3460160.1 Hsp70 family protein [Aetokthonos hydrillicola CCALA 1050]MBW4590488.1 Hsp70 family protein [Aetokthonos hydrillicola CCALA 1050]MDR9893017.1 Hsp70 family protein [Aetokthonos hydrillicola Thurmond2011]